MLIYSGGGYGGFLPDVPARDLSDEEVAKYGGEQRLLRSGLYYRPKDALDGLKIAAGATENKVEVRDARNKSA